MDSAINLFDVDCTYEDTLYPGVFQGRETLKKHLFSVADSLPTSFKFCLDVVSEDKNGILGVSYTELIPLLIEAIKELSAENKILKSDIKKIKDSMNIS